MDFRDVEAATSNAIQLARARGYSEVGPDELLLGCLRTLSRFGVTRLGLWTFDLQELGVDWQRLPESGSSRVGYSDAGVLVFDRAARIARADGSAGIQVEHLLVAFAEEEGGLMGELRKTHDIQSAGWRAAIAELPQPRREAVPPARELPIAREYLTPEEAAEALGIHVQTVRGYVRSGKLPALRIAGERAIRIRRADLDKVLEPLVPERTN